MGSPPPQNILRQLRWSSRAAWELGPEGSGSVNQKHVQALEGPVPAIWWLHCPHSKGRSRRLSASRQAAIGGRD